MAELTPPDLGDALPDDLVPAAARGKYSIPDNARRRRPAVVFAASGVLSAVLWFSRGSDGVLVNSGFLLAAIGFAFLAAYFAASARAVKVWEDEAIAIAKRTTELDTATARAQLAWRGLFGRPVWRVLVHQDLGAQVRKGVVIVAATDGSVVEHMTEEPVPAS